jgi:D-glycero-alpha-D-manno-heptose-7-phosphate kinase
VPPLRVVNAVAPTRVCDLGGWTDTWFARHGKVLNLAVSPSVEVQLEVHAREADGVQVLIDAEDVGERSAFSPDEGLPGRHPLLEAAVDLVGVPSDLAVRIAIHSAAPMGASTGTSAAVVVALVGALDALTSGRRSAHQVATDAHRVEVERLGLQSGVQDQLCSAYGGICFIDVAEYPSATVTRLHLSDPLWWELDRRLLLVFLGPHRSSEVHERVIAELEARDDGDTPLPALRSVAERGRDAVRAGDLIALGRAMRDNTAIQAELAAGLVSSEAEAVIAMARDHGVLGWKVNGAGGDGGSVTLLCGHDMAGKRRLARALGELDARFRVIPVALSGNGLRVWEALRPV